MNILQGMTWPLGTKLGRDKNDISMRFDSHKFQPGDRITCSGNQFHITEVLGDWITCKWLTWDNNAYIPDTEIVMGMQFLSFGL